MPARCSRCPSPPPSRPRLATATPAIAATDSQGPIVTSVAVVPASVAVSQRAADATVDVRIRDTDGAGQPGTGVDHGTVTLSSGANRIGPVSFDQSDLVSGTATDGTYDIDVPVAQGTASGSYTATVTPVDVQGNTGAPVDAPSPLVVDATPESTPPALTGPVTAGPSAVDLTRGGQDVTYGAGLTDAGSGVVDATLTLRDPTGSTTDVDLYQTSGTPRDGRWTGTQSFAPSDPAGDVDGDRAGRPRRRRQHAEPQHRARRHGDRHPHQ